MTIDIDTYKEICIYVCPNAYLYKVDTRSNIISVLSSLLVDFLLREKCRGNEPGRGRRPDTWGGTADRRRRFLGPMRVCRAAWQALPFTRGTDVSFPSFTGP